MLSALIATIGLLSPITPQPIGDGGSVAISLQNATVHPQTAEILGATFAIPPHGETVAWVQCAGEPPPLTVRHQGRAQPLTIPAIGFDDGPPALWITRARRGRAALEKRISRVRGATAVEVVDPKAVPAWFGALRFAPLLMTSVSVWAELSPSQRDALRRATASGAVLVIGAGEGEVRPNALEGLTTARFGALERVGPALLEALGRASTRRVLHADRPRVVADGQPLVAAYAYGLGEIRLVGARLTDVDPGPVGDAVFGGGGDALGPILDWIGAQPGLAEARRSPLAPRAWYALLSLLVLAGVARFAPRVAVAGGVVWVVGAAILPPGAAAITQDAARAIAIPITADEHLIVGAVDLTLGRGGHHRLAAGPRSSLDEARPGGACRLAHGEDASWIVAGEPNARRRLTIFGFGAATPGADAEADPPAPGTLRMIEGSLLPALLPAEGVPQVALHFTPAPPAAAPPLILQAAPEE